MRLLTPSNWELAPTEAMRWQRELASLVRLEDRASSFRLIAGVDVAAGRFGKSGRVAVLVWDSGTERIVDRVLIEAPIRQPYIPGLLALREGPLIEAALEQLGTEPDLFMFDGHGIAHPRGLGIAAHIGVLLDRPSIGIGKSPLFGEGAEPGLEPRASTELRHPEGHLVGYVLRSRSGSKPIWVSPGNRISPAGALTVVKACLRGHRLPEPVHLADRLSKERS
jgi:deoxyribonuclease V